MTDKEKAIVMAHTGICMLTGDKFYIFHKYVEELMGRPILTHEIGWLADAIKEKSKVDFMTLCADESSGQKPKWIPCSERLPEEGKTVLDVIRGQQVQFVINTFSVSKKDRITDGFLIRREAVENNIPCLTSLDTAKAVYKVLESMSFAIDAAI